MTMFTLGILHPGEMGISLAAAALRAGHEVYWASAGRSAGTRERAEQYGLKEVPTLKDLCDACTAIISVCPPHAAEHTARQVLAGNYRGIYVDANAISPQHTQHIGTIMSDAGVDFVDGGIIGPPAWKPKTTWLYVSGAAGSQIPALFRAGPLETQVLGDRVGDASALKICFAAYNKGSIALLCAVLAAAQQLGVRQQLQQHWDKQGSFLAGGKAQALVEGIIRKAWRFTGEMEEIAATFEQVGVTGEFHAAANHLYEQLIQYKDIREMPPLQEILEALVRLNGTVSS
jgi:3-hydroxyisobutyrate dehydrogenase-like beta-hydroxyacid dehydrogenase